MTCPNCNEILRQLAQILDRHQPQNRTGVDIASENVRDFMTHGRIWIDPEARTPVDAVYQAYLTWCVLSEPPRRALSKTKFGATMNLLGFPTVRGGAGVRLRVGVTVERPHP